MSDPGFTASIDVGYGVYVLAIRAGDALAWKSDALALKYAQKFHGVDEQCVAAIWPGTPPSDLPFRLPSDGEAIAVATEGRIAAETLVLVGVGPLQLFEYAEIRDFSRRAVRQTMSLQSCRHLSMTLHGINYGLDEEEAFTAQIAGLLDSIRRKEWPSHLEKVTIVERDPKRVKRLSKVLEHILPKKIAAQFGRGERGALAPLPGALESAGAGSRKKPHIFVAMPFEAALDDLFHYGIEPVVRKAGFLCERADLASFTGDIVQWIKDKIEGATILVAELSDANANVYLEVGYAWAMRIPTILLVQDPTKLKFDVKTQRCLVYAKIQELEERLDKELRAIVNS
jgi:hypothetical protein